MKQAACCLTIPAEMPFLHTLAAWMLDRYKNDDSGLAQLLVLLPNRRACRALQETFLALTGGKPMILPRIRPIGDLEENDLPSDLLAGLMMPDLPPAIASERRLMLLSRLVMQFSRHTPSQAMALSQQLARFLDDMTQEHLDMQALKKLAPQELAQHWQQTLDFLEIVSRHWPKVLESEGVIDAADRRNRLLLALAAHWQRHPPGHPVIAAGSTGTQPATAALLSVIARLPHGQVILPGLDQDMPDSEWDVVEATHPQYALKQLLERMECARNAVGILPSEFLKKERIQCLRAVLQPPQATAGWAAAEIPLSAGMKNVRLLAADTPQDEARMIAVTLREALEIPGRTAALVTQDRALARMVVAQMQRFGIAVDDSAGRPLLETPAACLLRLAIEMIASEAAPADLLSVLRHPLAAAGRDSAACRRLSRILEKEYLRGVRPSSGWQSLVETVDGKQQKTLHDLLVAIEKKTKTLSDLFAANKPTALSALLEEHLQLAEWLASTDNQSGDEILWVGDDGNQLAEALARIVEHADVVTKIDPRAYPAFFESLLATQVYRPRYGFHPRLSILSPIEARLQRFDRVILGGLNEGVWPAHPAADPWMSRPMREKLDLPPLERSIGQGAHDFYMLAAAEEVFLTRARKSEGAPTIASRWLVRLETLLKGKDSKVLAAISDGGTYERAVAVLDAPAEMLSLAPPKPLPPLSARPREIGVTDFDLWQRDPYIIYAKRVLKLKPLDPLDQEPDLADFGTLVHDALKLLARRLPDVLSSDAYEKLIAAGREVFAAYHNRPTVMCVWWPRFEAMAAWVIAREGERRSRNISVLAEQDMHWQVSPQFAVKARVDRVEIDKNRSAAVIDYKTGVVPTQKDWKNGLSSQLQLEALMLLAHKQADSISALEYWKLSGREEDCEITTLENIPALLAQCRERLDKLIADFGDSAVPFAAETNPSLLPRYNDYEHLTRRKEWGEV